MKDTTQKSFESGFLAPDLKQSVDTVNAVNFTQVKGLVVELISNDTKFGQEGKSKHLQKLETINSPKKLQFFFYSYILAAEGKKVVKAIGHS